MVKEHAASIFTLIQATPINAEGISKVFEAAVSAIKDVENDFTELLDQHGNLGTIISQYAELHRMLQGEQLRKSGEIEKIPTLEPWPELETMDEVRRKVLQIAARNSEEEITADTVLAQLRRGSGKVPWRNPKAAISTILLRSGRWKKKEKGVFLKVAEVSATPS